MIKESDSLVIMSGAVLGVESGIPDLSSDGGIIQQIQKRDPSLKYYEIMSHSYFENKPNKFWYFYGDRYNKYK